MSWLDNALQRSRDMTQTERPSATEATRRVDAAARALSAQDEILAVTEDFVSYVAERSRGITVATPARRLLRDSVERLVLAFIQGAEEPAALDRRAEARVREIVRQTLVVTETENGEKDPPPPPPDRTSSLSG